MTTPDDLAARMYAAAEQPDRGQRTPGAAQVMKPVLRPVTDSTPPPAAHDGSAPPADGLATPANPNTSPTHVAPARANEEGQGAGDPRDAPTSVDELVDRELTLAQRMYEDGGQVPDDPLGYAVALAQAFDGLEREAREAQSEEDTLALREGRQTAQELLHELQVPAGEAGELVREVARWHGEVPEETRWEQKADAIEELQRRWGRDFEARVSLARKVADDASRKMPWFGEMLRNGLGNSPELIARLAEIGLRNARKARRAQR